MRQVRNAIKSSNETTFFHHDSLKAAYNSDGLIKCLPQPGQLQS